MCRKGAKDLNAWIVSQGHTIAFRRYSTDYGEAEAAARAAKRGIWAGTFQNLRTNRKAKRVGGDDPTLPVAATAGCAIKGNISAKGDKIYHVPGTRDYERTRIKESDGERMFCSEDEAKAAGWRAPRG